MRCLTSGQAVDEHQRGCRMHIEALLLLEVRVSIQRNRVSEDSEQRAFLNAGTQPLMRDDPGGRSLLLTINLCARLCPQHYSAARTNVTMHINFVAAYEAASICDSVNPVSAFCGCWWRPHLLCQSRLGGTQVHGGSVPWHQQTNRRRPRGLGYGRSPKHILYCEHCCPSSGFAPCTCQRRRHRGCGPDVVLRLHAMRRIYSQLYIRDWGCQKNITFYFVPPTQRKLLVLNLKELRELL
jgi:hypothetical protein